MKNLFESRKLPYVAVLTLAVAVVTSLTYGMGSQMEQNVFAQNDSADSAQLQTSNVTGELTNQLVAIHMAERKSGISQYLQMDIKRRSRV